MHVQAPQSPQARSGRMRRTRYGNEGNAWRAAPDEGTDGHAVGNSWTTATRQFKLALMEGHLESTFGQARRALVISYCGASLAGGAFVYLFWRNIDQEIAVCRCAVFVSIMAGV